MVFGWLVDWLVGLGVCFGFGLYWFWYPQISSMTLTITSIQVKKLNALVISYHKKLAYIYISVLNLWSPAFTHFL